MTDDLRAQAVSNLKAKSHFWQALIAWVVLSVLMVVIWLLTSGYQTYFWPVWPILGIGLGVVFAGIAAFGSSNRGTNEAKIQAEMDRLSK